MVLLMWELSAIMWCGKFQSSERMSLMLACLHATSSMSFLETQYKVSPGSVIPSASLS